MEWSQMIVRTETGYKCPDCEWTTTLQYRNAKKAFKAHWTVHHYPEPNKEEVEIELSPGEEMELDDLIQHMIENHKCGEHSVLLALKKVIDAALE